MIKNNQLLDICDYDQTPRIRHRTDASLQLNVPDNGYYSKKMIKYRSFWILFQKLYIFAADK